jgi:hypothetical protein
MLLIILVIFVLIIFCVLLLVEMSFFLAKIPKCPPFEISYLVTLPMW